MIAKSHRLSVSGKAFLIAGLVLAVVCLPARGEKPAVTSEDLPVLKAVVVYKICKFITWPEDYFEGNDDLVIGVLGTESTGPDFTAVAGKPWRDGKVKVYQADASGDLDAFHVLYVNSSQLDHWRQIRGDIADHPLLTISDIPGFAEEGGLVQLVLEENRLRFLINREVADASTLQFSSQLLKIARLIGSKTDES